MIKTFKTLYSFSTRKLFIGGNWKSNNTLDQTKDLVNNVINKLEFDPKIVGTSPLTQMLLSPLPSSTSPLSKSI